MKLISRESLIWSSHVLSREISQKFVKNNVLVINPTWLSKGLILHEIETWVAQGETNKVVILSLFDPMGFSFEDSKYFDKITLIDCNQFCFWLLAVDRFFLNYSVEDVEPQVFKNKFLCYQRKPSIKRIYLFEQLTNKPGIVTIGNKEFHDVNSKIPHHAGLTEVGNDHKLHVDNDIWSLGNIDIWNSSFLNIVSETEQFIDDVLFVSEKIFKPIIGLRPFICFGNPRVSEYLRSMGFEIFDEEFNYAPTDNWQDNANQIVEIVNNIDTNIYNTLMPKLLHNKNWLTQAAKLEWKKVNDLSGIN